MSVTGSYAKYNPKNNEGTCYDKRTDINGGQVIKNIKIEEFRNDR